MLKNHTLRESNPRRIISRAPPGYNEQYHGNTVKLSGVGEHRLIEWIRKGHCGARRDVQDVGIGDDCAVVRTSSGKKLLITTDSLVEDTHFSFSYSSPEMIGEKSVSVSVSDIAAMGGVPKALFLNLGFPSHLEWRPVSMIISGIHKTCTRYGIPILGGDTCATPRKVFISITVLGEMKKGKPVLRCGAKVGDILYLSGTIGASALGLYLLKRSERKKQMAPVRKMMRSRKGSLLARRAIRMFQRPIPHINEGRFFAERRIATAMIDLSDGFSMDLHTLCMESGVGAAIHQSQIPIDSSVLHFASTRSEALRMALSGGEEYCLLIAVPKKKSDAAERQFEKEIGRHLTKVGEITEARRGIMIISERGISHPLLKTGYEHFKR